MSIDPDSVSVRDVMQTDMVILDIDTPIEEAIETFEDYGISGAPVIDENGHLCGVMTASDALPSSAPDEAPGPAPDSTPGAGDELAEKESQSSRSSSRGVAGRGRVADWMTPEILTVGPDATLGEVCALMHRETVHRVFVADGKSLVGVVSASDVVSYVAKSSSAWAGDEWR